MAVPELAPRRTTGAVVGVWIASAVIAVVVGLFVPPDWRAAWLVVGLGVCIWLSFGLQLANGRSHGFILRVAAGFLGALVVMGVISLGFGLASVVPG